MAIKALIATLILGSSTLALAEPGYGREIRTERREQGDRAELRHDLREGNYRDLRGDRMALRHDRREERRLEERRREERRLEERRERERRFERMQELRRGGWRY